MENICPLEMGYINRQYFWPFVFCSGIIFGATVMIFWTAKVANGLHNSIKLSEVCKGVK